MSDGEFDRAEAFRLRKEAEAMAESFDEEHAQLVAQLANLRTVLRAWQEVEHRWCEWELRSLVAPAALILAVQRAIALSSRDTP